MKHVIYIGEHPRPGTQVIDVRPGLRVYLDDDGGVHSITTSRGVVDARDLVEVLSAIRCAPVPDIRRRYDEQLRRAA